MDPQRITALLSWYDEPADTLERAIRSASEIVTSLVAVDGAYASFPGGEATSDDEQRDVIQQTARDCGLDLLLYQPSEPWAGGEIEKRDRMFRMGDATRADWFVILDADFVFEYPYRTGAGAVFDDLAVAKKRGFEVCKVGIVDYLVDDDGTGERKRTVSEIPLFYRAAGLPPLHISGTHYHTTREGYDTHLWGCAMTPQLEHFDMTDTMRIQHEWWHRDENRQVRKWGYYLQRGLHGLEKSPFASQAETLVFPEGDLTELVTAAAGEGAV